ncbi:hypothetical protein JOQ06_012823, partial [Pogonophryne albipinna]
AIRLVSPPREKTCGYNQHDYSSASAVQTERSVSHGNEHVSSAALLCNGAATSPVLLQDPSSSACPTLYYSQTTKIHSPWIWTKL